MWTNGLHDSVPVRDIALCCYFKLHKHNYTTPLILDCNICSAVSYSNFVGVAISGVLGNFVRGGVQQIQLRTEDRENGDLRAVAPYSGVLEAAVIWYKKFHFI
jgi:hypothetical protein